jgi:hypothetical protein
MLRSLVIPLLSRVATRILVLDRVGTIIVVLPCSHAVVGGGRQQQQIILQMLAQPLHNLKEK